MGRDPVSISSAQVSKSAKTEHARWGVLQNRALTSFSAGRTPARVALAIDQPVSAREPLDTHKLAESNSLTPSSSSWRTSLAIDFSSALDPVATLRVTSATLQPRREPKAAEIAARLARARAPQRRASVERHAPTCLSPKPVPNRNPIRDARGPFLCVLSISIKVDFLSAH